MSLRRNSSMVAAGIGLSRLSGFVRERAVAHFLGTSSALDAFRVAFRVPNLMQNLLGEGVLSASFIPGFSRLLAADRHEDAGRMAGAVAGLLGIVAGVCVLAGVLLAEPLTTLLAPGFLGRDDQSFELTVTMMRILFPAIGLLVLSAWCLGVLNSHRRFFLSYVAPVLWNAAQIAVLVTIGLLGFDLADLAVGLAWGVLIGSALQLGVQLPSVLRLLGELRLNLDASFPPVRQAVRAFFPIVGGRGVVQVMSFVEVALASLLASGAIAMLGFAQQLYLLPISLFGMSVAAAELPSLSTTANQTGEALSARLREGLARIAFFVAPTVLVYMVLGQLVVGALFQTGQFGVASTRAVWLVLAAFSVGLVASTSSRLLQSSLFAADLPGVAARIAATRVVVAAAIGAALMLPLDQVAIGPQGQFVLSPDATLFCGTADGVGLDCPRLGAAGLAIGAGVSAWLELWLLRRTLRNRLGVDVRAGGGRMGRTLTAVAVAALVAIPLGLWLPWHPLVSAPIACLATGVVYLAAAERLGLSELPGPATLVARLRASGIGRSSRD